MSGLRHALKEWAAVCRALASGRQAVLLRKGGIAEEAGEFRLEHTRFWLYPTFVHQQQAGIAEACRALLDEAEADRPPPGTVRLTHFAEVPGVYQVGSLAGALALSDLHCLSAQAVQARFAYRRPGLYVLPVRVYRAAGSADLPETAEYAGCKSWVELGHELPTDGAVPVLEDAAFEAVLRTLDDRLRPTAWV